MGGIQSFQKKEFPNVWKLLVLCAVSAAGNAASCFLVNNAVQAPLYLDTVFTVAITFCAGLAPGLITGLALSPFFTRVVYKYLLNIPDSSAWLVSVFTICVFVEIILVCLFRTKIKPREEIFLKKPSPHSFTGIAVQLVTLAAVDCIALSVSGGLIDFVLTLLSAPKIFSPEDTFKLSLLKNNAPFLAAAVLSRIPINIVDRFIAVFCGYGISLLYLKFLGHKSRRYFTPRS